nr:hypothetical protein [Methylobacterium frigidaeris]
MPAAWLGCGRADVKRDAAAVRALDDDALIVGLLGPLVAGLAALRARIAQDDVLVETEAVDERDGERAGRLHGLRLLEAARRRRGLPVPTSVHVARTVALLGQGLLDLPHPGRAHEDLRGLSFRLVV